MRVSVRKYLLVASISLLAPPALAGTTGVYLPPAPTGAGGEDSIETSSGTRCRQSMNSNGAYVDLGVTGTAASQDRQAQSFAYSDTPGRQSTAYARVTIPIGPRPKRIDCSEVYQLELAKLRREVELLKLGVR